MLDEEIKQALKQINIKLSKIHCNINHLNIDCIPEYISDAAAIAGGLSSGDIYRTTSGVTPTTFLKIVP